MLVLDINSSIPRESSLIQSSYVSYFSKVLILIFALAKCRVKCEIFEDVVHTFSQPTDE